MLNPSKDKWTDYCLLCVKSQKQSYISPATSSSAETNCMDFKVYIKKMSTHSSIPWPLVTYFSKVIGQRALGTGVVGASAGALIFGANGSTSIPGTSILVPAPVFYGLSTAAGSAAADVVLVAGQGNSMLQDKTTRIVVGVSVAGGVGAYLMERRSPAGMVENAVLSGLSYVAGEKVAQSVYGSPGLLMG